MQKILYCIMCICFITQAHAQSGYVLDSITNQPIEGAIIKLLPSGKTTFANIAGRFEFNHQQVEEIRLISIGYKTKEIRISDLQYNNTIKLSPIQVQLENVVIVSGNNNPFKPISKTDIAMRGVNNSQEVLRIIPGIVIGQHQGGGKAEQIFLRGFDADHGTDFRMDVDGLPVNMVSHAHGQGFADSHFIIPETIGSVDFNKGPYAVSKGDFATTGYVDFNLKNALAKNLVKLEAGMFNTYRALGMFNLLNNDAKKKQQSWYVATEYRFADAYFDYPQHFNRFNFFTKYTGKISKRSYLSLSATTFWSKWNASGQIPDRAVEQGIIGFYGALDPLEGGKTYRTNLNAQLTTSFDNGDIMENQFYYSNSFFDLHTDFTFFLEDSINGDEIRQKEKRNMLGYNGSYIFSGNIGNVKTTTEFGLNVRADFILNSELSHTKDRFTRINYLKLGDISQLNVAPYVSETFQLSDRLNINAGLRFDQFYFGYKNKFAGDSTLPGIGNYTTNANTFSPKLNIYYHINSNTQFYFSTARGFHSNDARAAVVENGHKILPAAYAVDLGTIFKPAKNIIINLAAWYIYLEEEFVYSGDGGFVEFSGKTKRVGFDFSGRYEPFRFLYIDVDVNYAYGRAIGEPKGADRIPLAPIWTSTGGITYSRKTGFNGSLRYRYVGDRPGNEDYSLTAVGYFITDAVINYTKPKFEIGVVINNLFNAQWKETQFATETRLKNEAAPVDEICFTPGTPFSLKLGFTWFF